MLTKTTFLRYLNCPKDFWLWHHKKEVFEGLKQDLFREHLARQGYEVERWARRLFPEGKEVQDSGPAGVAETEKLMRDRETIFQATLSDGACLVRVDVLSFDVGLDAWVIGEVKGSTSKEVKREVHYADACFQKIVLERCGVRVGRVNLVELNKEFRKEGDIVPSMLLKSTDITEKMEEMRNDTEIQIADALKTLQQDHEPRTCNCVYKSRKNHCESFAYSHPEVPEAGAVQDICLIGNSPKRLAGLVDDGHVKIKDVPWEFELSPLQKNHVHTVKSGEPCLQHEEIGKLLTKLEYPLYFLDYETFPSAVPIFDGCYPYQQVPFQYSLHVQQEPGGDLEHYAFLHQTTDTPLPALAASLAKVIGETGSVVVWNQKFERKCNEDLANQVPEYADFFQSINQRLYDLMEIFQKQHFLHPDFEGSYSIKAVLPVLVPELSYKTLGIQDGARASQAWWEMVSGQDDSGDQTAQDLLTYCELDTLAMVRILEVVQKI